MVMERMKEGREEKNKGRPKQAKQSNEDRRSGFGRFNFSFADLLAGWLIYWMEMWSVSHLISCVWCDDEKR